MKFIIPIVAAIFILSCPPAKADLIPYPNAGTPNPITYTFTAAATGHVIAYFAGSGAAYDEQLGMLINGVMSPNGFGLDDHSSALGQSFDLGSVTAGDVLTFAVDVISPSLGLVYSDPALNGGYDFAGSNHVFSTQYTATSTVFPGIPVGTYVAFEDLRFPGSDFNYFDETYVFTNVATNDDPPTATPEPTTLLLLGIGVTGMAFMRRRKA